MYPGVSWTWFTVQQSLKSCRYGLSSPSSQKFLLCDVWRPAWLQRISGTQLLFIQPLVHCSHKWLRPKLFILCSPPSPTTLDRVLQSPQGATLCSSCTTGWSRNKLCFQPDFFAGSDAAWTHRIPAQPCFSYPFKKLLCGTYIAVPNHWPLCTLPP